jgi:hypothetical protein
MIGVPGIAGRAFTDCAPEESSATSLAKMRSIAIRMMLFPIPYAGTRKV